MGRGLPIFSLLALLAVGGCQTDQAPVPALSVVPGMATITFSRPAAYAGLIVNTADVSLDGNEIASLKNGDTYSNNVQQGPAVITVICSCGGGTATLRADLAANQQYRFLIKPPAFDWNETGREMTGAVLAGPIGILAVQAANHVYDRPVFDVVGVP